MPEHTLTHLQGARVPHWERVRAVLSLKVSAQ